MPIFDMPLEELKRYNGINPRPWDFDEYWDEALKEMGQTPHDLELIPAEFQTDFAECFHLYFDGTGGSRIHAKYVRPANRKGKCPVILMFHGYSVDSGDWTDKLSYVAAGFCVAALDCRGQGDCPRTGAGQREPPLNAILSKVSTVTQRICSTSICSWILQSLLISSWAFQRWMRTGQELPVLLRVVP